MRILIVTGNPHIPQFSGGIESSTHDLALELQKRGHYVAVLCRLTMDGGLAGFLIRLVRDISRHHFPADRYLGYPIYRQRYVLLSIPAAVREFIPDVAIVQVGEAVRLTHALGACDVPVLFYLHDATFNIKMEMLGGSLRTLENVQFIANSAFTARRYRELFDIESIVIPPLFIADRYQTQRKSSNVTFINPHVLKGKEIAFRIAEQCPEIPFSFVESWPIPGKELKELSARIRRLPNVTLRRRTENMKSVYSKAKILLVPSICEEAWGRVVTEAQFSGIPVLSSHLGGLPESVGPGGIMLDPNGPVEPWVETLKRLWSDEEFYREKSAAALAHSKRPQISTDNQIDALLEAAKKLITKTATAAQPMGTHGEFRSLQASVMNG